MFTGLITAIGTVRVADPRDGGLDLEIAVDWPDLVLGESIAVDGACLTVAAVVEDGFAVHVVATSLERTTFGRTRVGDRVNLERALQVGDRLGGHLVQGHVDGVGEVLAVARRDDTWLIEVAMPAEVAAVTIPLGSITVAGVSLTANAIPRPGVVQLAIVPFTLEQTTLGALGPGDPVHLEGDLVGKHVRAQAAAWRTMEEAG
ncbi:MAG: riboflavin synthase [Gemmatimonadetes bacterium]|nr:riboflavin synthase [Gemmatimonadota bacterium]MCB9505378.1 riboflavin synthase [Gemmatimonadales bacterium]MCB9518737.1 riboflavin synthase [Gemmatimonadales bacterium]HPF61525.1 riboflavin synthase [Gemmatimonadales bacterium]HRX18375.1 riboflavin synthase [Gemmatimonadales bacterium]